MEKFNSTDFELYFEAYLPPSGFKTFLIYVFAEGKDIPTSVQPAAISKKVVYKLETGTLQFMLLGVTNPWVKVISFNPINYSLKIFTTRSSSLIVLALFQAFSIRNGTKK